MNRSLQRHLSRMLALAIVAAGLVAAAVAFAFAYYQAEDFQDDTLRQIAALAVGNGSALARRPQGNADAIEGTIDDSDSPVTITRLPAADGARPAWLPAGIAAGFHTLRNGHQHMRVFVRDAGAGRRVAVAQDTDVRDDAAFDSAVQTLLPLLVLLPVLVGIAATIVRAELVPMRHLARQLDDSPAERPPALPDDQVPEEIAGFVHAINRLLARVATLVTEQQRFIADAAHELRTPLTALSVQAQNLDQARSLPAMHERLAPLRAGIERARQLTEQLLTLARSHATDDNDAVPLYLPRFGRELVAELLPLATAKGIDLGLDETAELTVAANPETLRMILKNALDNAIRYTPPGGEVTLRLARENGDAVMQVVDTGPGIPAEQRERVFDPFYRLPGSAGDGSGLGLAIAREAASRLGGSVTLDAGAGGVGLVFAYRQELKS